MKGEKEIAQNYFESIERGSFSSYRIKELLLSNALSFNKSNAQNLLDELEKNDLNIKKYDLIFLNQNNDLLNPILNQQHGMAEVLYNISSWFFSKTFTNILHFWEVIAQT